jgi:4-amino-4-deoxy-L-arabinose transferase-like glycosyltransferase
MTGFRDSGFFSEKGLTLIALCLWLLPGLLYFSFTMGNWSWYYLATIAPPLAGLVGISAVAMYHEYRTDLWMGWLLVVAVLVTGLMEAWKEYQMFVYSPMGYGFLLAVDLAGCICCAGILVWLRTKNVQGTGMHSVTIACIAVAVLFVAPVVWSCAPLTNSPEPLMRGPLQGQAGTHLSAFLVSHAGNYTFLVAVPSGEVIGSTLIVDTGKPVMALGGFFGTDQILTAGKLPGLIRNGTVRYFLIPFSNSSLISLPSGDRNIGGNTAIYTWVTDHCTVIPASEWSGSEDTLLSAQYALYDCAGAV